MKKAIIALLVFFLLLSCACSRQDAPDGSSAASSSESSALPPESEASDESGAAQETSGEESGRQESSPFTQRELCFERDGMLIYGRLYLPEAEGPVPLAILSHGFSADLTTLESYAEHFASNGVAAYIFDFIGGGMYIRSGGDMADMSVLTETADLNAVINGLTPLPETDPEKIFLFGESQGGFVATCSAAARPSAIAGLILLYPAYNIPDICRAAAPDPDEIPDALNIFGVSIGRAYVLDATSVDVYGLMREYPGRVLMIHGTEDGIVPLSCSERAADTFPDAQLVTVEGAGHGFSGGEREYAASLALEFIRSVAGEADDERNNKEENTMKMTLNGIEIAVEWEQNESVEALKALVSDAPLTVPLSMYGGFEQVGPLGSPLPRLDVRTTTSPGDIMLYAGSNIVLFYGSNTWEYTRLGRIAGMTDAELKELLSNGDLTAVISMAG